MQSRSPLARVLGIALTALCLAAFADPSSADDVYLTNGRVFEDVVAKVSESSVTIRLPYGEMRLPKSRVLRIETGGSSLQTYLERKSALEAQASPKASDWLALARWSEANDLPHGLREAALMAALLEPDLDGLSPVMHRLDYRHEPDINRWVTLEESMRRRGFVEVDGQWISRQEYAELVRMAREDERERREAADSRALRDAAVLLLARAEADRQAQEDRRETERQRAGVPIFPVVGGGFVVYGGVPVHGRSGRGPQSREAEVNERGYGALIGRQPGSLISETEPILRSRSRSHRGGFSKPKAENQP